MSCASYDIDARDLLAIPNPASRSSSEETSNTLASSLSSFSSFGVDDPFAPKPVDFTMVHPRRIVSQPAGIDEGNGSSRSRSNEAPSHSIDDLFEDPAVKKLRRRQRRRMRMALGGASGFVVGGVLLGPIGACAGCVSVAAMSRVASKAGEKRKDRRIQREIESHTMLV